jgi:hypothetical protein
MTRRAEAVGAPPPATTEHPSIASDLLWEAPAIAAEIGVSTRRAYYLLDHHLIPGRKIGGLWVASRRQLRAALCGEDVV